MDIRWDTEACKYLIPFTVWFGGRSLSSVSSVISVIFCLLMYTEILMVRYYEDVYKHLKH